MRHTNDTARQMLATGEWAKAGKTYIHQSGLQIIRDRDAWLVNGNYYAALWVAWTVAKQILGDN